MNMPAFDGTGPVGIGPMTGWGRGRCRGFGRGQGSGIGRRGFCGLMSLGVPRLSTADERAMLQREVQSVSEYLKDLQARLKELGDQ